MRGAGSNLRPYRDPCSCPANDKLARGARQGARNVRNDSTECDRLVSVPGIEPIISSAMVAAIGTGDGFSKGRDFAAWMGLMPK